MDRSHEATPAPARKPKQRRSRWSPDEHKRFLDALSMFGRDWKKMEEHVGTRTAIQLRSHAQKYFEKAQKMGVSGLPPPRPKRKRKNSMPVPLQQQPAQGSSSSEQPQCAAPPATPEMQSSGCASILGRSTSASPSACLKNHGGVGTDQAQADEPAAAAIYSGDNSFMGTPSFFSEMSMALEWAGSSTGSTSLAVAPPPSSLPEFKTMLPGDEPAMEPWDIIMQEIKDIGLAIDMDMDMTIFSSIIPAGGSECGSPPPHHGVPGDWRDTNLPSPYV